MNSLTLADHVVIPSAILAREVGGETVLLNLDSGMYFGLDSVGTDVWRLLGTGVSLAQAATHLIEQYDVERAVLEADLLRLVNELAAGGLVTVVPRDPAAR
jgi:hypothetical protein